MNNRRYKEVYVCSADPFERGVQHGSQVRENILKICEGYEESFAKKGYTWSEAQQLALSFVP
ncbi:MAG: hypothetical protein IJ822_09720, partial [Pyramidobacter sp.]|nr:hypothetical protein [Pyramidobacter sp.]